MRLNCGGFGCTGLVLLSVATSSAGLISGAAILSLGIAFTFPSLSAMALSSLTDQTERASLIGSFGMFFEVGAGLGGFLIGPVAVAPDCRQRSESQPLRPCWR